MANTCYYVESCSLPGTFFNVTFPDGVVLDPGTIVKSDYCFKIINAIECSFPLPTGVITNYIIDTSCESCLTVPVCLTFTPCCSDDPVVKFKKLLSDPVFFVDGRVYWYVGGYVTDAYGNALVTNKCYTLSITFTVTIETFAPPYTISNPDWIYRIDCETNPCGESAVCITGDCQVYNIAYVGAGPPPPGLTASIFYTDPITSIRTQTTQVVPFTISSLSVPNFVPYVSNGNMVISPIGPCSTPTDAVLDFISCCGIRVYFQVPIDLLPSYGNVTDTYIYNGPPIADVDGTIMYPGQCYYISQKAGALSSVRPIAPPPTDFTPLVGTYPTSCDLDQCQHCFYLLTNCQDPSITITTYSNLSANLNEVVTITGSEDCWLVTETAVAGNPIEVTIDSSYSSCLCCTGYYFTLNDCCTNEPYKNDQDEVVVLRYKCQSAPNLSPADFASVVITSITNTSGNNIKRGCYKLTEIQLSNETYILDWEQTVQQVTTVDICDNCYVDPCYLLEDCQGAVDPIITCTDLSQYVDNVVKLSHCGNICWKVTLAESCENSILVGEVIANYPAPYVTGQICTYAIPSLDKLPVSYYITINGNTYEFPYSTNEQVLIDLNSLNLGEFSVSSNALVVIGENNYGTLCYKYLTGVPICIAAVCSTYQNNCQYVDVPQTLGSRTVFITINGTVYTTLLTNFNINKLLQWLNSLNLGIFTVNCISSICSINVYGNEVYDNIVVGTGVEADTYTPICTGTIDFAAACEACLPPAPTPLPLMLHPRRIKPGYFTKNSCITTEYMERVNCNFTKQVYDAMLIKRYGITVCCDHDVDSWDIKKQVLDFELLTDPSLCKSTLCYCLAPCFVSASITVTPICIAPILIDATIDNLCYAPELVETSITVETEPLPCNCYVLEGTNYTVAWIDCCCVYQSTTFISNSTICAHYPPVILNGTVTITAAEKCGSELCVAPSPVCYCWLITPDKEGIDEVNYTTCDDIPVIIYPVGEPIAVCSPIAPNIIGSGTASISGFCNLDCGIVPDPKCYCYTVSVQTTNDSPSSAVINSKDCNNFNIDTTVTINSTDSLYYICSLIAPKVLSATPNAQVLINILYDTACVDCIAP